MIMFSTSSRSSMFLIEHFGYLQFITYSPKLRRRLGRKLSFVDEEIAAVVLTWTVFIAASPK